MQLRGREASRHVAPRSVTPLRAPPAAPCRLQRSTHNGGHSACACGGECPRCRAEQHVQPKLAIGKASDHFEQEADRIADEIVRAPEPNASVDATNGPVATGAVASRHGQLSRLQRKCACGGSAGISGECAECREEREDVLQRHAADQTTPDAAPPIVHEVLRSPGQPVDAETLAFMQTRFGRDFGHVRVHTDAQAAAAARAINARAFTLGRDIVFGMGQYAPQTGAGRRLLAHELTHTVQQAAGGSGIARAPMAPMIQAQFDIPPFDRPLGEPPPPPDIGCSIDLIQAAKALGGDKRAALEVIDCCLSDLPVVGRGCTSSVIAGACKLLPDLCEKKKKEKKKPVCPIGFKPAQAPALAGKCCPEKKTSTTELGHECCAPGQIITELGGLSRCCPPPLVPNDDRTRCVTTGLQPCPPDRAVPLFEEGVVPRFACACLPESRQNQKEGVCCPVGQDGSSGTCVPEGQKPEPPPPVPPAPPPFTVVERFEIGFEKDAPQVWFDPGASFRVSVTSEGKTAFNSLVARLETHPEERVQLEARASSDKPPTPADYNRRLTDRRVQLIAGELKKKKIDVVRRVTDPPGQAPIPDCESIAAGQWSCGDAGAAEPPDKKDRKVAAAVFSVTQAPSP